MDINNFQRVGSVSNAHVGRDFESVALEYFRQTGVVLKRGFPVRLGAASDKQRRLFDLGSESPPVLVECKSHRWTVEGNVPSAKVTVWNEAMYYFFLAPQEYRKILFVLRDFNEKREESLAMYYVRHYGHLIPRGVEILEYDEAFGQVLTVR